MNPDYERVCHYCGKVTRDVAQCEHCLTFCKSPYHGGNGWCCSVIALIILIISALLAWDIMH